METTTTAQIKPRRPRVAFWLSFLGCGLGHIYCGKFGKGIVLFFISMLLGVFGRFAILPVETWLRRIMFAPLIISTFIWIYSIIDARRTAKRMPPHYVLKDYNRWYVYLLLVLLEVPLGIGVALHVRVGMLEAMYVASKDMYPTLRLGDRFLVNKLAYTRDPLRRGDIVVFPNPNKRNVRYVKRVVALPGDTVEIRDSELHINGKRLHRSKIGDSDVKNDNILTGETFQETNETARYQILLTAAPETAPGKESDTESQDSPKTTIPNGHCFVLGDNRNNSHDSRNYGPVPMFDIVGRVDYVYYPRWVNLKNQRND